MIESLLIVSMRILAYCLMPNHWHFVLWPAQDDQLSDFMQQMADKDEKDARATCRLPVARGLLHGLQPVHGAHHFQHAGVR